MRHPSENQQENIYFLIKRLKNEGKKSKTKRLLLIRDLFWHLFTSFIMCFFLKSNWSLFLLIIQGLIYFGLQFIKIIQQFDKELLLSHLTKIILSLFRFWFRPFNRIAYLNFVFIPFFIRWLLSIFCLIIWLFGVIIRFYQIFSVLFSRF